MSDLSAIMDALVTAAETVSNVTAGRILRYADEIKPQDFPFACIYDPEEVAELGDFQLVTRGTTVSVLLFTKGETQNALLTKMDAFRDAIEADRTLGGIVQFSHVASRAISEDNRPSENEPMRAALMTVETVNATGRIFHVAIELELILIIGAENYSANMSVFRAVCDTHLGPVHLEDDWVLDHETFAADRGRYQLRGILAEIEERASGGQMRMALEVHYYYHFATSDDEQDVIEGTIWPKIDGLLNPSNWRDIGIVSAMIENPVISISEVTREG